MEAIKNIVNASWFKAGLLALVGLFLLFDKDIFYSGIAFGIAFRELFFAFKQPKDESCCKYVPEKDSKDKKSKK